MIAQNGKPSSLQTEDHLNWLLFKEFANSGWHHYYATEGKYCISSFSTQVQTVKIAEISNQILVGSKHQMNCGINKQHNHQEIMSLCLNATDSKVYQLMWATTKDSKLKR